MHIEIIQGRPCDRCDTKDRDARTRRCLLCALDRAEYVVERYHARWGRRSTPREFAEASNFITAYRQAYRDDAHRAKARRSRAIRRGRLHDADGSFTTDDLADILKRQGGRCAYCRETRNLHIDHKTPISRGGSNWPSNLQYLCAFHNLSKANRTDVEYRQIIGLPARIDMAAFAQLMRTLVA